MPFSRVCLAGVGDDLHVARVSGSGWRIRARRGPVLRGFLRMSPEDARRALGAFAGGGLGKSGRIVLTLPGGTCGVRPMELGMSRWSAARTEVSRAIGRLFPLEPEEALVGLVGRRPGGTVGAADSAERAGGEAGAASTERGYLVVASRREVGAWTDRVERALGREVGEVLSTHMAMLGLGLQHESRAGVIERSASGGEEIHWLRFGVVEELGAPWSGEMDDTTEVSGATLRRLPGAGEDDGVASVDGHELAIAGALASISAGGAFAPLVGKPTPAPRRWVAPVAGLAAAGLLLWAGNVVLERRYERAIDELRARDASTAERMAQIESVRAEIAATTLMIEGAVGKAVRGWSGVMPDLAAAHRVIPDDAFLYDLRVDSRRVFLRGEASRASDVLRSLESSPAFTAPTRQSPTQVVQERGTETFDLAATRAGAARGAAKEGGTRP